MSRPRPSPHLVRLVTVLVVAALALPAAASARTKSAKHRPHPPGTAAVLPAPVPAGAGAVIAVDPETGRLGLPSPEQMRELTAAERTGLLRTAEGLTQVQLPDGSWMSDLQGRFQTFSVVRLGPDGEFRLDCVDDPLALWRALALPTPVLEDR
jgi:hypothetical protein